MASTTILSDNGASSGSAGLKSTAGNDGVLILQTTTSGGTATNAVYIDTTQKVGLGTTNPGTILETYAVAPYIRSTTSNTAGNTHGIEFYETTSRRGFVEMDNSAGVLKVGTTPSWATIFYTNNTERMRVNAGAPILCLSGGNTSATGTGIAFPATQSASSDANTLDDYEEGTWTPTYVSTGWSFTYQYQNGWYVKIGQFVWCGGTVAISARSGSGTSAVLVGNLPFTTAGGQQNEVSTLGVGYATGWATTAPTTGYISQGSTQAALISIAGNTTTAITGSNLSGTVYMNFNISFRCTA